MKGNEMFKQVRIERQEPPFGDGLGGYWLFLDGEREQYYSDGDGAVELLNRLVQITTAPGYPIKSRSVAESDEPPTLNDFLAQVSADVRAGLGADEAVEFDLEVSVRPSAREHAVVGNGIGTHRLYLTVTPKGSQS